MKKIGVITMHRILNYGSILQAYATQKILEKLGYDCEIIDYIYPNEYQFSRGQKYLPFTWKNKIAKALWLKTYWRKRNRFERFAKNYLSLSPPYPNQNSIRSNIQHYDIYMTGSDQVWNPNHMKGDGTFLLDFAPKDAYKIAFSASFACGSLPEEYKQHYVRLLGEYKSISVREYNGRRLIKELIDLDVPVTLDPTLMLDSNDWNKLIPKKHNRFVGHKYIILYMLNYAFDSTPYIYKLLKHLQEETGFDIYSFSKIPKEFHCENVHYCEAASPITFLQLFSNASCVVTSSFHGTAFAVNFGIPVYSLVDNESNDFDDRQRSLLEILQLSESLIKKGYPIDKIHYTSYISDTAQYNLSNLRKNSLCYLKNALCL